MTLENIKKDELISKFKLHKNECGSTEVQISSLSYEINILTDHLKTHKKDFHSRVGLIKKVNSRKSLLKYLKLKNVNKYIDLIKELNIRK
ncbi:MAG: 30S ribosomal protein S15 [Enterobacteriaceae bacterium]|nr:30S ribosomal protein S15 [Enterobacteriaceae bacterium]